MSNVVEIIINAHDRTRSAFNSVRGGISNLISSLRDRLGTAFSGMSDALSGGLGGAFKAAFSNPYTAAAAMVGVAALVSTLAPLIALALGGALTVAMGGAFVGIGAMVLMQNEKVKADFAATFKDIGKILQRAFEPLMPVLDTVRSAMKRVAEAFEPFIKQASAQIAPHLVDFINNLAEAAIAFAPALGPMMDAFGKILDELGPKLPGMISSISSSLITMFESVGENADTFVAMIQFIMYAVNGLIVVIGWLIDQVALQKKAFSEAAEMGGKIWGKLTEGASAAKGKILEVVGAIRRLTGRVVNIGQRGADGARSAVSNLIGTIRRFVGKVVRIGENGARAAWQAVSNLIGIIRRLIGKVVRVGANVFGLGAIQSLVGWIGRVTSKIVNVGANILGFAHGGVVGAAGGGPRSNLVMVGEQGRELVRLPFGSTVMPNGQTEAMMAGASGSAGGGGTTRLEWGGGPSDELGRAVWKYMKANIRAVAGTGDGSVQQALGR